jgi:serine/threonine-protein kinase
MTVAPGTRLGPYEITAKLGEGGMGEVYRATDSKLKREVAIKVLPAAFTADPERLARFEREAQLLAQLHHPNIASIFGLEESGGVRALVMELVDGPTLAERLGSGALPLDEVLAIARQIAEALEAAHEKGIVHRDLKPQNVKVTAEGKVKVLDFGLAKAMDLGGPTASGADLRRSPTLMNSPTLTAAGTQLGVVLGTAAYMAPEQARGGAVDKRADIWAFGVVLYEMLTGERLFQGDSVVDTLSAVMRQEIGHERLPAATPWRLRDLLRRCLERDAKNRLRDIGDALFELDGAKTAPPSNEVRKPTWKTAIPWVVAGGLAIALLMMATRRGEPEGPGGPVRRFAIDLPWQSVPNWTDFDAALSPQGTHLAYLGRRDNDVFLYLRALDSLDSVPLTDAREAWGVAFSQDGQWLALREGSRIRKVSIQGGRAQEVVRMDLHGGTGLSWTADGGLLIGHPSGLLRVPSSGGTAAAVTRVDSANGETGHFDPAPLPDGTHALMTIARQDRPQIAVVDLRSGTYRTLPLQGSHPVYSRSGHLLFRQDQSVLAVRFDPTSLQVLGGSGVPVLEDVHRGPCLADDGSMLYVPERAESKARLVWVDRTGRATPVPGERLDYSHLALSPDGRRALLNIGEEVYVRDLEAGTRRLLASGDASFPIWTVDGKWATYRALVDGKATLLRQRSDGSAAPERLRDGAVPTSWNWRTGELAFFDDASDISILSPGGDSRPFIATPASERSGRFSRDGRWLAYVSDETGTYQVYVVPYPGPGPKVAISIDGGLEPTWSADGRELFFRRGGKLLVAALTLAPELIAHRPVELFDGPYTLDLMGHQRQDVAPDGRFLMVENSDDLRMVVVERWTQEVIRATSAEAKR